MGYRITTEVFRGCLFLRAEGRQTLEFNKELVSTVVASCVERGCRNVLVDIRGLEGQPGLGADYEVADVAARESLGKVRRAALLQREESREFAEFFEVAAQNQGIQLRAFVDEESALEWLAGDD